MQLIKVDTAKIEAHMSLCGRVRRTPACAQDWMFGSCRRLGWAVVRTDSAPSACSFNFTVISCLSKWNTLYEIFILFINYWAGAKQIHLLHKNTFTVCVFAGSMLQNNRTLHPSHPLLLVAHKALHLNSGTWNKRYITFKAILGVFHIKWGSHFVFPWNHKIICFLFILWETTPSFFHSFKFAVYEINAGPHGVTGCWTRIR